MLPKYTIEFSTALRQHSPSSHYSTDDPIVCEEFLEELLERGFKIRAIKHEGVELSSADFDRLVKTAAGTLASKRICFSLGIKPEEQRYRFGFAA
jgi:hypothetical protein